MGRPIAQTEAALSHVQAVDFHDRVGDLAAALNSDQTSTRCALFVFWIADASKKQLGQDFVDSIKRILAG